MALRSFSLASTSRESARGGRQEAHPTAQRPQLHLPGSDGKWHGRVTVGIRDDGKPDRRHVERKNRAEVTAAVRELERQRDAKAIRKAGRPWTVKTWLTHWVENIAPLAVNENTMVGYGVAVRKHLIPALGAHRLDKLRPEYIENFYGRMVADGRKAGTIHQIHRTFRTALNEAVRRGHLARNPVQLAKAPRVSKRRSSLHRRRGATAVASGR